MRGLAAIGLGFGLLAVCGPAAAAIDCPGNGNALGTSRVLKIDPAQYSRIGTMQYPDTLPLEDREVVLTFDDGPLPPYTNRILEILAYECIKANYFLIGRMARGYPELARRIYTDGHVVGTHSENHPLHFDRMSQREVSREIEQGIASVTAAIAMPRAVAPFFRIPGLMRATGVETYLRARNVTLWSADVTGDDWKHIKANQVVERVMTRLKEKGRGIILLHDIQPATALALPELLGQLKAGGFRIVQIAPALPAAPAVAAAPREPAAPQAAAPAQPTPGVTVAVAEKTAPAMARPASPVLVPISPEPLQVVRPVAPPGAAAQERPAVTTAESAEPPNAAADPASEASADAPAAGEVPAEAAQASAEAPPDVAMPAPVDPRPQLPARAVTEPTPTGPNVVAAATPATTAESVSAVPAAGSALARPFTPELKPSHNVMTSAKNPASPLDDPQPAAPVPAAPDAPARS